MEYPLINAMQGEVASDMSVKMVFSDDKLVTLGLYYSAIYDNDNNALSVRDRAQVEMDLKAKEAGVEVNVLGANFSADGTEMRMGLYIEGGDMDDRVAPFVMLPSKLETKGSYVRSYEAIGMKCE